MTILINFARLFFVELYLISMKQADFIQLKSSIEAQGAELVVVSKLQQLDKVLEIYHYGQRAFAENRVQDLLEKQAAMPSDVAWHLIGHLQSNKVKYIAPFIALIHSVDSLDLLLEINKQAAKNERIIPCLLQFHVAQEDSKFGMDLATAQALIQSPAFGQCQNIRLDGIMGMASFTDDTVQIRAEFKQLKSIFEQLKQQFFAQEESFRTISMGMSGDYQLALEEGSTMLRIGSLLFKD
jgi:pyridoxal phosphate enzyme (YggS family)